MVGRFDGNSIVVDIEVISPIAPAVKNMLTVKLDTGASNDLCLTYKEAFPLALTLVGVEDYTIADGSTVSFFECIGLIKFGDKTVVSTISIRPSGSLLMGVGLLNKLGYKLVVDFVNKTVNFEEIKIEPLPAPVEVPIKEEGKKE